PAPRSEDRVGRIVGGIDADETRVDTQQLVLIDWSIRSKGQVGSELDGSYVGARSIELSIERTHAQAQVRPKRRLPEEMPIELDRCRYLDLGCRAEPAQHLVMHIGPEGEVLAERATVQLDRPD